VCSKNKVCSGKIPKKKKEFKVSVAIFPERDSAAATLRNHTCIMK